jgi:hypothetical protein
MGLTTQNTDIKVKIQIQYCQTNNMVPIFILGKNTQANHAILSPNTNSIVIIIITCTIAYQWCNGCASLECGRLWV